MKKVLKQDECIEVIQSSAIRHFIICLHLFALISFATVESYANFTCVSLFDQVSSQTVSFGALRTQQPKLSSLIRVLVWNVHKGADAKLPQDFKTISENSDLALFQESVTQSEFTSPLMLANPHLGWTQTKSFQRRGGDYTGVATGSKAKAVHEEGLVSTVKEPLLGTSKTILISEFAIEEKSENLMVANIHAINFVTNANFKIHIDQLVSRIAKHQGPLIVAGDFNTWNPGRMNYLNQSLAKLGLGVIEVPRSGFLQLDHIYSRGLRLEGVFDLTHIRSSDHKPLMVDFSFLP